MSAGRTVLRAVLVTVAVTAVAWGTISVTGALSSETGTLERTVTGVTAVRVRDDLGSVTVAQVPGATAVRLRQRYTWWFRRPRVSVRRAGGLLEVTSGCALNPGLPCDGELRLEVPPGTAVDVRTDAALRLTDLSGPVRADSQDGRLTATGLRSRTVETRTADGRVDLTFAEPPDRVVARAVDGSIRIAVPRDGRPWRVQGRTGDAERSVEATEDPTAARTIRADSADGTVAVVYGD